MNDKLYALSDQYKNSFQNLLPLIQSRISTDRIIQIFDYIINRYREARENDRANVEISITKLAKDLDISWQTAHDSLDVLTDLGITVTSKAQRYNQVYVFPNKTLENSIFGPVNKLNIQIEKWTHAATSQVNDIKSKVKIKHDPVIHLDRTDFYNHASLLLNTNNEVKIFANSPGIILTLEYYDPDPPNKTYYDIMEKRMKENLKMTYVFDYNITLNILKSYSKKNLEKVVEHFARFLKFPNLAVYYAKDVIFPTVVIVPEAVIIGVRDESSTPSSTWGILVYEEILLKYFNNEYTKLLKNESGGTVKKADQDTVKRMLGEIKN